MAIGSQWLGIVGCKHAHCKDAGGCVVQVGQVEEGVRYTDELPQLHAEVKRDVHWIGAIHAQADLVCKRAVHLTAVVKASQGCVPGCLPTVRVLYLPTAVRSR